MDVLLATRNRDATLAEAIESVLAQREVQLVLWIMDDASEDRTPKLLERWSDDPRVQLRRNTVNLGLPASLNRLASEGKGEFLARIDDDDRWTTPDKLARQLAWLSERPQAVLLGTDYVDEWGRPTANPHEDDAIRRQMLLRCPFCHPSVVMRRSAFEAVGGYDESMPYAEDWELWMRLAQEGLVGNLAEVTLVKARGGDTMSERFFERQLTTASELVARHGAAYPNARQARWFHAFNRGFFRLFPAGGRAHTAMGKAFRRTFGLGRGSGS